MDTKLQRLKIAEYKGLIGPGFTPESLGGFLDKLPDYTGDLNAILAVVRDLPPKQKGDVVDKIGWSSVRQVMCNEFIANATAQQWSSAVLQVLGLWEKTLPP